MYMCVQGCGSVFVCVRAETQGGDCANAPDFTCMYIYVCMYMHIYVYAYMYIHIHVYLCLREGERVSVCVCSNRGF